MPKFMCSHTLPPNALKREQFTQVAEALQKDPAVKGYRSFANLSEGRIMCVLEASTKDAIVSFFKKMEIPYDNITQVEIEGDRGSVKNA